MGAFAPRLIAVLLCVAHGSSASRRPTENTPSALLTPGDSLHAGEELLSVESVASLRLQASDGNLVIYQEWPPPLASIWAADTSGSSPVLRLQTDGNLVLYDESGDVLWASHTEGSDAANATITDDCRFVLWASDGRELWSSSTDRCASVPHVGPVDPSTIVNKVLVGYQGWFGCDGDEIDGYGWRHWSIDNQARPAAGNSQFDLFPDLSEYPAGALYTTDLQYADGTNVSLYSNVGEGVVDLHFAWLEEYGIDGALVQRFLSDIHTDGPVKEQKDTVLAQASAAAQAHGRTFGVMWDISGASTDTWAEQLKDDFANVSSYFSEPLYLHEGGKPVVSVFGLGLTDHDPTPTADEAVELIEWLHAEGLYVIGSGPFYWRTGDHDSLEGYDAVYAAFDAIMPWAVGRYPNEDDFQNLLESVVEPDATFCAERQQDYAPIAYPGYSFANSDETKELNSIPRNGGKFFRAQIDAYLGLNATFFYVAMMDEVNEGTAIYKAASNSSVTPVNEEFIDLSIDGAQLPSDYYLQLTEAYTARAHARG